MSPPPRLDELITKLAASSSFGPGADHGLATEGPAAAVAAILREGADGPELFFIRRAERADDPWSGHVAFPGGRRDPEDASLLATAIRETREEVGIELTPDQLLARLPDVPAFTRTKRGNLVVTPFVFAVSDPDVKVTPNHEVDTTLWVPISMLADEDKRSMFKLDFEGKQYDLPCIHLDPGQYRLWGMTFRMLETLLDALR